MVPVKDILVGLTTGQDLLGNPVFNFDGNDYGCIPSVNEFKRELDSGGFATEKMLTMTVPIIDENQNAIFITLPTAQEVISYNGEQFRIESTHTHPTGVYMRIIAMSTTHGI